MGTAYIGVVHPALFRLFELIPTAVKEPVVYVLSAFMLYDILLSDIAVRRWRGRVSGEPAGNRVQSWADEKFPDSRMEKIYPNMLVVINKKKDTVTRKAG